jgi:hypothetical protein
MSAFLIIRLFAHTSLKIVFRFNHCKVLDPSVNELEKSNNHFAIVVLAARYAIENFKPSVSFMLFLKKTLKKLDISVFLKKWTYMQYFYEYLLTFHYLA